MFNEKERNNLFLRQSCLDSWEEYLSWMESGKGWDYIVLTPGNWVPQGGWISSGGL